MDKRINGKIKMINWKWSFWAKIEQKNVAKQRVRDNFFFFFVELFTKEISFYAKLAHQWYNNRRKITLKISSLDHVVGPGQF